jgi:hypothetical protein
MPLNDRNYRDILEHIRVSLRERELGGVDERIMSDLRGSEGPFYDLVFYLKHLIEEVSLGSDEQLRGVLRRIRSTVHTQSGEPVQGIRVELLPEERERYGIRQVDFAPTPELQEVASELRDLLQEIQADRHGRNEPEVEL